MFVTVCVDQGLPSKKHWCSENLSRLNEGQIICMGTPFNIAFHQDLELPEVVFLNLKFFLTRETILLA